MAATTAGALKAYIEGLCLGLTVYRDAAPSRRASTGGQEREPAVPYPYVTIREDIASTYNQDGDLSDPAATGTVREDVQVDLWQQWRDGRGRPLERYGLSNDLARLLRGARLVPVGTRHVDAITRVFVVRLLEPEANVVHHAITCTVNRRS